MSIKQDEARKSEPKQDRRKATIAKLREAAAWAIREHGRDAFTTRQIAEFAAVGVGTVYTVWRSRVDVLDDLYPNRVEGLGA